MTDQDKNRGQGLLRIALPSDGELYESTLSFMRACGLTVSRPNSRRYTGSVPAIPAGAVLFPRPADVTQHVWAGPAGRDGRTARARCGGDGGGAQAGYW